jgi:hypothetical protein
MGYEVATMNITRIDVYAVRRLAPPTTLGVKYPTLKAIADALRHDHAFVFAPWTPKYVAFPYFRTGTGRYGGWPDLPRWRSYGFGLSSGNLTVVEMRTVRQHFLDYPKSWITFHTFREGFAAVTAAEYMKAKSVLLLHKEDQDRETFTFLPESLLAFAPWVGKVGE